MSTDVGEKSYLSHTAQEIDDAIDALPSKAAASDLTAEVTARQQLQAAVSGLINGGSKNYLNNTAQTSTPTGTLTFTVNDDKSITIAGTPSAYVAFPIFGSRSSYESMIPIPKGTYVLSGAPDSPDAGANRSYYQYGIRASSDASITWGSSAETYKTITISNDTSRICVEIYISDRDKSAYSGITYYPMICTKADWDISQSYVPYCPTLYELYQMILDMQ